MAIIYNFTGMLSYSIEGAAYQIRYLLNNPEAAKSREHVREKFLITSKLRNYLLLFLALSNPGKSIF